MFTVLPDEVPLTESVQLSIMDIAAIKAARFLIRIVSLSFLIKLHKRCRACSDNAAVAAYLCTAPEAVYNLSK